MYLKKWAFIHIYINKTTIKTFIKKNKNKTNLNSLSFIIKTCSKDSNKLSLIVGLDTAYGI